jgi:hypothetical protein
MKPFVQICISSLLLFIIDLSIAQNFELKWKLAGDAYYVGDLDNDGFGEFVLETDQQFIFYDFRNRQPKWFINKAFSIESMYRDFSVFQDFNGNGVKDVICGPSYGTGGIRIVDPQTGFTLLSVPGGYNFEYSTLRTYALLEKVDTALFKSLIIKVHRDTLYVFGTSIPTSANTERHIEFPTAFLLQQNYPNPFNPSTTISWEQPTAGQINVSIYDITGRRVRTLLNKHEQAGSHSLVWDGTNDFGQRLSTGAYFYMVTFEKSMHVRKMLMLK